MENIFDYIHARRGTTKPTVINVAPPPLSLEDIKEAREYYIADWVTWPASQRRQAMRNVKGFDWIIQHQQGLNIKEIAYKYNTTQGVVSDFIKRARGRVETYIKIRGYNETK